jgi:flagellar hook-basal body complex protein FliE
MSIPAIEASGFTPFVPPTISTPATTGASAAAEALQDAASTSAVAGAPGVDFAGLLADGLDRMQAVNQRADDLAVQAATGDLANLHDYTIAATEAKVTTQLTTAVRNKALEAFLEIMRMPI